MKMLWLNFYLLQDAIKKVPTVIPDWLQYLIFLAPLLSFLAAFSNLLLARYIFKFTRQKNDTDRNIKWFQELVYNPHKEALFSFFNNLNQLKANIPNASDLNEEEKIKLMEVVKKERNTFMNVFVDLIKNISPEVHYKMKNFVDELTDDLIKVFDNDELKWSNERVYEKEISNRIYFYRDKIIASLFDYKG